MSRVAPRRWVGIDGEGLGRLPHRYTLLAASDGEGRAEYVEAPHGKRLGTARCFDFLLSYGSRDVRLAGYYLSYDWTMILRELPNEAIYRLFRPELRALPEDEGGGFSRVAWREYRLHFLAGMMQIRRGDTRVTIWDIARFFQSSFVKAIELWKVGTPEQHRRIASMKEQRATFRAEDRERVRAYCLDECRLLATLAERLEDAHDKAGLRPKAWHGPGSTASAALSRAKVADFRAEPPREVRDFVARAFFGGRFEQSRIGRVEGAISHDIVSAYPFQALSLPCLRCAAWRHTSRESDLASARFAVVRAHVVDVGVRSWAPLPVRLASGSIVFPRGGATTYAWLDEYRAAKRGWRGVEFDQAWVLDVQCEHTPFSFVEGMFRARQAVGKDSGAGLAIKLGVNSVYGKVAQSIGKPQFASRVWAGMITSGTRAQLLGLISAHRDERNVIAVATDGIYTTEEIDLPPWPMVDLPLGSWETKRIGAMTFVRPGIYYSHEEDASTVRARGLGRRIVAAQRDAISRAIERGDARALLGTQPAFGGARVTVYRTRAGELKRSRLYGEWHPMPARISLAPAPKRDNDWLPPMLSDVESLPYARHAPASEVARVLDAVFDGLRA